MKKLLLVPFYFLISTNLMADNSIKSKALAGKYSLVKASSDYAERYHCSEEIEITVNKNAVVLEGLSRRTGYASFWSKNEGCQNSKGDIGPLRTKCTRFNKKSVSHSDTSFITIVGFVRTSKKLKLKGKDLNKLIYSNNITQVPFGIFGIWNDDEFKCEYTRI